MSFAAKHPPLPIRPQDLVASVRDAVIAGRDEGERIRRLPPGLLAALKAAGAFRLQTPVELGGFEASLPVALEVFEQFGRLDGAVAWNVWNGNLGVTAGLLDPAGVDAIWGDDPDTVIANSGRPTGGATVVDGGFRLSGRWDIVSAVDSADWVTLFGLVMGPDGPVMVGPGMPDIRAFFVRTADVTILDTWNVSAMRGTGSNSVVAEGAFVPSALAPSPFAPVRIDRAVFRVPAFTSLSCGSAAVCLGIAQASIDLVVEMAPSKATAAGTVLAETGSGQRAIATADTHLRAARLLLHDTAAAVSAAAEAGDPVTIDQRAALRAAMCHAAAVTREVVTALYELGSSSSLYVGGGLERVFRDGHAAAQHGVLNPFHLETVGRVRLGLDPGVPIF